jgi:hypothetical protein
VLCWTASKRRRSEIRTKIHRHSKDNNNLSLVLFTLKLSAIHRLVIDTIISLLNNASV